MHFLTIKRIHEHAHNYDSDQCTCQNIYARSRIRKTDLGCKFSRQNCSLHGPKELLRSPISRQNKVGDWSLLRRTILVAPRYRSVHRPGCTHHGKPEKITQSYQDHSILKTQTKTGTFFSCGESLERRRFWAHSPQRIHGSHEA